MRSACSAAGLEKHPRPVLLAGDASTLERLATAIEARPDLGPVAPFWLAIYRVQIAAREELAAARPAPEWTVRRERLQQGLPQLEVDDLPLESGPVEALIGRLAEAWRQHDPTCQAAGQGDWVARVRRAFADPALAFGQQRQLDWNDALAALALGPYLEWAAGAIAPRLPEGTGAWGRGWCPVCGGLPDLALLVGEPAARSLVCSRCNTAWAYHRVSCPYCDDTDRQMYHAGDDDRYRLYVCGSCRRYLKTIEVRHPADGLDPRVERLITIGMDLAALEAGYGPEARDDLPRVVKDRQEA